MIQKTLVSALFFSLVASSFSFSAMPLFNQLGFTPESEKIVVIPGNDANPIEVRDVFGKKVLDLKVPYVSEWPASGEETQVFDLSSIKKEGTYRLFRNGEYLGNPIIVSKIPYEEAAKASLKWFYYQRAGVALEYPYAGKWARAAGHPDDKVIVYGTDKVTNKKAPNTKPRIISSAKGWYDAGDYGKYIVNSTITVFTLLALYEHFPAYADTLHWNIPTIYKNLPPLLDEVRWNLEWMLSAQDKDGGVFHKVTTLKFSGSVAPEKDTDARYAIIKNVVASLDFAGVMAQASVVYKKFDKPFADKMLKAAEKAYAWAKANPKAMYVQPEDVQTGSYAPGNEDGKDEFRFAASELYNATKKDLYLKDLKNNPFNANGPWWGDLNFLAVYRVALSPAVFGDSLSQAAKKILIEEANSLRAEGDSSAYRLPMHTWNWNWGSNSAVANNGIILLHAYYLTKDKSYLDGAQQTLDYLLGKNPLEISYVTGFGYRSPKNPHHRPSESDFVDEPVPGMLVGGPHLGKQDIGEENWKCKDYAGANKPALAYIDHQCSYATNEVAINWNAPFAYLASALQAIYSGLGAF